MTDNDLSSESTATPTADEQTSGEDIVRETASPSAETAGSDLQAYQRWYLLASLSAAPDRQLKAGDIKRKVVTKRAQQHIQLSEERARELLEDAKQAGHVVSFEKRGTVVYQLNDTGLEQLNTLSPHPALASTIVADMPVSEELLRYQHACLLMHLLDAQGHTLSKSEANGRLTKAIQQELGLTPPIAGIRRMQLAKQGYVDIAKDGRQESYHLTADGRDYLAALEHHPTTEFRLRGAALNALLIAARESPVREGGVRESEPGEFAGEPEVSESRQESFAEQPSSDSEELFAEQQPVGHEQEAPSQS